MAWTVELCDLEQGGPGAESAPVELADREAGATVEIGRHTARLANVPISESDEAAELVSTGDTVLRITHPDWTDPVFCGRVNTNGAERGPEETSRAVTASDPLPHLAQKAIYVFDTVAAPDAYIWRAFGPNQPDDIIAALISNHAADAGIAIGATPGGATAQDFSFPLGSTVLDGVLGITGVDDSVEFELTPTEATDGTLVTINCFYPQQGSDLSGSVTLKIGIDSDDNLLGFSYEEALVDLVNRVLAVGDTVGTATRSGSEYPLHYLYIAEHSDSITQYGAFEQVISASGQTDAAVLEALAKAAVAANAYPIGGFSVSLDPTSDLDFSPDGDFWIGDVVSVEAGLPSETLSLTGRVATATLTEQENGEIAVALTLEPETELAGVTGTLYNALIDASDGTAAPPPEAAEPVTRPPKPKKKPKKGYVWVPDPNWHPQGSSSGWIQVRKENKKYY